MNKLSIDWIKHLKGKEKEDFATLVRNSTQVLTRLKEVIEELEEEVYNSESGEDQYEKDWQYLQAHRNGKKQALRRLKKLVTHL